MVSLENSTIHIRKINSNSSQSLPELEEKETLLKLLYEASSTLYQNQTKKKKTRKLLCLLNIDAKILNEAK